ncbi:uncharacterized protein LACBIDRAFT_333313 [Laccaria bicolor S238N-H82]|uniref:Predicted protein n=1 Tax=Laccaria bicolor (strain S238N-H82 / ATCC MYA-4686) TaxID=486041 RepID=B0DVJ4_LACBS|nr:uncharacterized protein LACBIDRAFT_333313 [Laccaria bicolor S238N-H82]EDR01396.1 predicted protein [Laccaria bicolor S238N-H82]|eukprot:XP_001887941.1 predicted protein [Laccaria bicolor S238N-H82]
MFESTGSDSGPLNLKKAYKPQTTDFYWILNQLFFASTPSLDYHPVTRSKRLCWLKLIVSISFLQVDNACPNGLSVADVAGGFNDAQLDDGNTLLKSSTRHASGRRQTSHMHRSSHRLHPPIPLFGPSPLPKLAQCSELLGIFIPDALFAVTYMLVAAVGCHNITHTDRSLGSWSSSSGGHRLVWMMGAWLLHIVLTAIVDRFAWASCQPLFCRSGLSVRTPSSVNVGKARTFGYVTCNRNFLILRLNACC